MIFYSDEHIIKLSLNLAIKFQSFLRKVSSSIDAVSTIATHDTTVYIIHTVPGQINGKFFYMNF